MAAHTRSRRFAVALREALNWASPASSAVPGCRQRLGNELPPWRDANVVLHLFYLALCHVRRRPHSGGWSASACRAMRRASGAPGGPSTAARTWCCWRCRWVWTVEIGWFVWQAWYVARLHKLRSRCTIAGCLGKSDAGEPTCVVLPVLQVYTGHVGVSVNGAGGPLTFSLYRCCPFCPAEARRAERFQHLQAQHRCVSVPFTRLPDRGPHSGGHDQRACSSSAAP